MTDNDIETLAQRVDQLEEQLQQRDQMLSEVLDTLPKPTRRQVLASAGVAGLAALASPAAAAGESWANATGTTGTDSEPLANGNIQDLDVQSLNTGEVNNTRHPDPGDVQSAIDDLAAQSNIGIGDDDDRGVVRLRPAIRYDEGAEIHVKPGVTLDFNGAVLTHSSDHNLVFVDNGGRVKNGQIDTDAGTFASDAIVLDTSRSTYGKYSIDASGGQKNAHSEVEVTVLGDDVTTPTGVGVALRDNADAGITMGCQFDVTVAYMESGILLSSGSTSGFITVEMDVDVTGCINNVDITSGKSGAILRGQIQPTVQSAYGIRNRTSSEGVRFEGRLWDPANYDQFAVSGPKTTVVGQQQAFDAAAHADGSSEQYFLCYGIDANNLLTLVNAATGDYYAFKHDSGDLAIRINFSDVARFTSTGDLVLGGTLTESGSP